MTRIRLPGRQVLLNGWSVSRNYSLSLSSIPGGDTEEFSRSGSWCSIGVLAPDNPPPWFPYFPFRRALTVMKRWLQHKWHIYPLIAGAAWFCSSEKEEWRKATCSECRSLAIFRTQERRLVWVISKLGSVYRHACSRWNRLRQLQIRDFNLLAILCLLVASSSASRIPESNSFSIPFCSCRSLPSSRGQGHFSIITYKGCFDRRVWKNKK